MSVNLKYDYVWHVNETATPFPGQCIDARGAARTDIASATFTLTNADTDAVLIDGAACQSVTGGLLTYAPSSGEMATACRFLAQFRAVTNSGGVLYSAHIEGEIEANL